MSRRLIIDLRTEPERAAAGYYPQACSVPVPRPPLTEQQIQQAWSALGAALADTPRWIAIAVHCAKGVRSRMGAQMLRQMGFTNVEDWGAFRG